MIKQPKRLAAQVSCVSADTLCACGCVCAMWGGWSTECGGSFFKIFIYRFLEKERGRGKRDREGEGERKKEKYRFVVPLICTFTGSFSYVP